MLNAKRNLGRTWNTPIIFTSGVAANRKTIQNGEKFEKCKSLNKKLETINGPNFEIVKYNNRNRIWTNTNLN